jgi:L-ascorbate metabolism protein UlaG (beta-lactamase superfamily)
MDRGAVPKTLALLAAAGLVAAAPAAPPRGWTDPAWFDGMRFHQPEKSATTTSGWLRRTFASKRGPWRRFTDTPPGPPPPRCVEDGRLRITFVNHATFLLQMDGLNILTDPTWGERSAPVVGVRRRRPPGLRFEDLPPIDAVLVSHDHHDHMDLPTLARLEAAWHPSVYTGLRNGRLLHEDGVQRVHELAWWQSAEIAPGVVVTAVPARHTSGRNPLKPNRTLWCGFVVSGPSGSIYFAGDTGWGAHFAPIGEAFPNLRLALLPIGGFRPEWYMREQHMGPADAVAVERLLNAGTVVPMHFGTFPNAADAELEPVETLRRDLAGASDVASRFAILDNGESLEVPPARPDAPS